MKDRSNVIILCISLLLVLLGFLFFEIRNIPDVKWQEKFDYEDKEPMGLFVFKELVTRYFKGIDSEILKEYRDTAANNGLYFYGHNPSSNLNIDSLLTIIDKGNDVFIFSNLFPYDLNDTIDKWYTSEYQFSDTVKFNFTNDSLAFDSTLIYQFVDKEFSPISKDYQLLSSLNSNYDYSDNKHLVTANDSLILLVKIPFENGNLFFHVLPQLFNNYSYRQSQMFDYTEKMLSYFDPEYVVFLNRLTRLKHLPSEHPLQFIMSSPPLKTAYYLFVLGLFLYAVFGGKRKQKSIPITDKNENTSLEYIATVSQLFYQQDQHEKLVAHMKSIFYHKMEQKYFIKKDNPEYLEILTKKSKIPKSDLQYILDRFRNLDENYSFRGDQLVSLNKRLEQIYQFINKNQNTKAHWLPRE
ncbi:MAG: hypothetical protein ACJA1A_003618 [Saprospiraceae bacterium]|jgi:hypothetical protein